VLELQGQLSLGFMLDSACPIEIARTLLHLGGWHAPLIEQLRLIKSPAEIEMIRCAARYADQGVQELFQYSYYGSTVAEGVARTSHITQSIIREDPDWDPLTTKALMVSFPAPWSAMPHSVPAAQSSHRLWLGSASSKPLNTRANMESIYSGDLIPSAT